MLEENFDLLQMGNGGVIIYKSAGVQSPSCHFILQSYGFEADAADGSAHPSVTLITPQPKSAAPPSFILVFREVSYFQLTPP